MLIDYHPEVVRQIREMGAVCKTEQPEFDCISREVDRVLYNMFATTADEHGIARFEEELGIVPVPGKELEERRILVLIRMVKKNLSFREILQLVQKYSKEVDLMPHYADDELEVVVDNVANVESIYRALDEIIALNIFIYLSHEDVFTYAMQEIKAKLDLESAVCILENAKLFNKSEADMEASVVGAECFKDFVAVKQYDLWHLYGSVKLDGSRLLDAEEIEEVL